ncbi:hypothetical protein DERF_012459 [Dermatophagoides farinae]|uniref:Uncharacterized protein n=1 Tax=Dermatophagoides farinae TaxID=6954 RepID=A0A922HS17_DERFA|nr:hypothetical protein DERF_012459 [Dermatophagoides farinae]
MQIDHREVLVVKGLTQRLLLRLIIEELRSSVDKTRLSHEVILTRQNSSNLESKLYKISSFCLQTSSRIANGPIRFASGAWLSGMVVRTTTTSMVELTTIWTKRKNNSGSIVGPQNGPVWIREDAARRLGLVSAQNPRMRELHEVRQFHVFRNGVIAPEFWEPFEIVNGHNPADDNPGQVRHRNGEQ